MFRSWEISALSLFHQVLHKKHQLIYSAVFHNKVQVLEYHSEL